MALLKHFITENQEEQQLSVALVPAHGGVGRVTRNKIQQLTISTAGANIGSHIDLPFPEVS